MTSIGQVEYRMHEQFTGIYRDGILFAKIHTEGVYLLNKGFTAYPGQTGNGLQIMRYRLRLTMQYNDKN